MRSTTRLAVVAAAAAALLVGSATTATAQSTTIDDRRYDVLIADSGTLASKGTYAQRVASSRIDVDTFTVNHGKSFVSIRANFHRLTADGNGFLFGGVKANSGASDDFEFYLGPDGEGGVAGNTEAPEGGSSTYCSTASDVNRITGTSKLGTGGFIQIYVPRACFDNPSSIKVGSGGFYFDTDGPVVDVAKRGAAAKILADPTDELYIDLVNATYVGAPQYTKTLARN